MRRILWELLKLFAVIALVGVPMWFASPGPRLAIANGDVFAHLSRDGDFVLTLPADNEWSGFRVWNTRTGAVVSEFRPRAGKWRFVDDTLAAVQDGRTLHGYRWRSRRTRWWSRLSGWR